MLFDFDAGGRRLLAVTKHGMLYCWDLASGELEILPRPQIDTVCLKTWQGVIGVENGFALFGHHGDTPVVAHYDCGLRRCTIHQAPVSPEAPIELAYVRHCHSVILTQQLEPCPWLAIDLATGGMASHESRSQAEGAIAGSVLNICMHTSRTSQGDLGRGRAADALRHAAKNGLDSGGLMIAAPSGAFLQQQTTRPAFYFNPALGSLWIFDGTDAWDAITPHTDGKTSWARARIHDVRLAGKTLAVRYQSQHGDDREHLVAWFRGPRGDFLRESRYISSTATSHPVIRLSSDGARCAVLRNDDSLDVQFTDRPERILHTRPGGFGTQSRLWIGDGGMILACGRKGFAWHLLQWSHGPLEVHTQMKPSKNLIHSQFRHPRFREFLDNHEPLEANNFSAVQLGNPERWPRALAWNAAWVALDRFGQILVFDADHRLAFQFFAHGDSWSAWLPNGMRHGRGMVHTWPNSPGALAAMGAALRVALGGERL